MNNSGAIKQDGTLWIWGTNQFGQVGDGNIGASQLTPKKVGVDNDWEKISIGWHSIAKKSNGSFWVWGRNTDGQLGNGTNTNSPVPLQMNQEYDWKDVQAGYNQTYALKINNTL